MPIINIVFCRRSLSFPSLDIKEPEEQLPLQIWLDGESATDGSGRKGRRWNAPLGQPMSDANVGPLLDAFGILA